MAIEVSITRADLEEQLKVIKEQQREAEIAVTKCIGAVFAIEHMLEVLTQRERNIAHIEAFKQMEEDRRKQAEIDSNARKRMLMCPNCRLVQEKEIDVRKKCDNAICFYTFYSDDSDDSDCHQNSENIS